MVITNMSNNILGGNDIPLYIKKIKLWREQQNNENLVELFNILCFNDCRRGKFNVYFNIDNLSFSPYKSDNYREVKMLLKIPQEKNLGNLMPDSDKIELIDEMISDYIIKYYRELQKAQENPGYARDALHRYAILRDEIPMIHVDDLIKKEDLYNATNSNNDLFVEFVEKTNSRPGDFLKLDPFTDFSKRKGKKHRIHNLYIEIMLSKFYHLANTKLIKLLLDSFLDKINSQDLYDSILKWKFWGLDFPSGYRKHKENGLTQYFYTKFIQSLYVLQQKGEFDLVGNLLCKFIRQISQDEENAIPLQLKYLFHKLNSKYGAHESKLQIPVHSLHEINDVIDSDIMKNRFSSIHDGLLCYLFDLNNVVIIECTNISVSQASHLRTYNNSKAILEIPNLILESIVKFCDLITSSNFDSDGAFSLFSDSCQQFISALNDGKVRGIDVPANMNNKTIISIIDE